MLNFVELCVKILLGSLWKEMDISAVLGFSAGVMIYVSFVDLLSQANIMLVEVMGKRPGSWATVAAFFGGY